MNNHTLNRDEWLDLRRQGIGSSDIAAVCGLSPWDTALGIWFDKLGMRPATPMTPEQEWGLYLEDAIAEAYQRKTGRMLYQRALGLARHPQRQWMLATPDRVALSDHRMVELKTASPFRADEWGEPGTDQIPEWYVCQVQWQMGVCEVDFADVAVLIGGSDFRIYTVARSQLLIDTLIRIGQDFWEMVEKRQQPPYDWKHPSTPRLVEAVCGLEEGLAADLDDEAVTLAEEWLACREEKARLKAVALEVKAKLLLKLGHASTGRLPDGREVRRRIIHRQGYTVAPTEYEDFRILMGRGKT